jgi:hypothetical protein
MRSRLSPGERRARAREAVLDRLAWQIAELRASLDKIAAANAAIAAS